MKLFGILFFFILTGNVIMAQENESSCQARLKSYGMRSAETNATVTLDVYSKCELITAKVEAYLGTKKVSKDETVVETHPAEGLEMYSFTVSKEVAKNLEKLTFKIREKGVCKKIEVVVNPSLFKKGNFAGVPLEGSGRVKKVSQSVTYNNLRLDVRVVSDIDLTVYPALIVSLNGIDLNRYELGYYLHNAGQAMDYTINLPLKYVDLVKDMSFRIVQSDQTYLELKR